MAGSLRSGRRARVALGMALTLLLAACGSSGAPAASSQAPASSSAPAQASAKPAASAGKPAASAPASAAGAGEKVKGAWVAVGATQSPLWAAKEGGYFQANGIEPDLTLIRGSATAAAALLSNNVGFVEMSGPGTVNATSKGADLVMIAGFVNIAIYKLDVDSSIKPIDDLKGKNLAISAVGGQDDFVLRKVLKSKGLTPDVDVHLLPTKDIPGSVAALKTHQVQGAILAEPEDVPALEAGAHELIDITGMRIPFAATGLVATRSYLKSHHTEAVNFLKSMVQGIRRLKTDRAFTDSVMSKYLSTTDKQTLDGAWHVVTTAFEDKPYPSIPGIQEVIDENDVTGHKPDEFVDSSVMKELDDSGFFNQN